MIKENIKTIQRLMKDHNIDVYVIPTSDFHQSEYVGAHFACRKFMSGFTGSAGTMIITEDKAYLWTDGRYFIQVAKQLEGSDIILMKQGLPGVESISEFLARHGEKTIGFDGRVVPYSSYKDFTNLVSKYDLVDLIWKDRPAISKEKAFDYDIKYCGESRKDKLKRVREAMGCCNHHIITSLDDIVWLYNIRGKDIPCNPVVNAYSIINENDAYLYVQDNVIDDDFKNKLLEDNIIIKEYNDIYEDVKHLDGKVLLDSRIVNYSIYTNINSNCKIVEGVNPTQLFKAIKNDVEIKNTKNAHIKDGVAMTKFMYWLKHTVGTTSLNEVDISDKLEAFRKEEDLFYDLSFDTICGYKENAALMHYKADRTTSPNVLNEGMLLIDSGGQYLDGTIDTTRTFVLGPISKEEKRDFTIALKGMFRLQNAHFLHGLNGTNLDILARGEVYNYDLDYRCGTGHGVGHFLNVHEGPNGFRAKDVPGREPMIAFEPGMITTDEPGIYIEGQYGIRHENELLCVEVANNEYGQFLAFEPITMVPFDIAGLDYDYLSNKEIESINNYQLLVFNTIKEYLSKEIQDWYLDTLIIKE